MQGLFITVEGIDGSGKTTVASAFAERLRQEGFAVVVTAFEQLVRAICNLPLGSTELYRPAAIANLLGDLWEGGEPNWAKALELPEVKLHLYGKAEPRPGRKMGHLTATAETPDEALQKVLEARRRLKEQA